ncbi:MAG: chorismate synthase [Peptococcaceae bacterium]|jgi:chorismate synthase|nr:chorismate synthase [Peptococcaceae bacterium]
MMGRALKLTIFGESHGESVGMVLEGLPPGLALDMEDISQEMERRAPGRSWTSTARREPDRVVIQSGLYQGKTTGTPLCGLIKNTDVRSADYEALRGVARPGHADWTGHVKYGGYQDPRGGGHFSGRLTAPLVFAGAVARQFLRRKGVAAGGHVLRLGGVADRAFDPVLVNRTLLDNLREMEVPLLDLTAEAAMRQAIRDAVAAKDSVGGIVECAVTGLPAGLGAPFFDSMESVLSHLLFSVPAVKAVEFGDGFGMADQRGSRVNDELYYDRDGSVRTRTNHNGGINGGLTNGMPLLFKAAVKPTPSIGAPQKTVNFLEEKEIDLEVGGRHDPCVVLRALPAVEAAAVLAAADFLIEAGGEL